MAPAKRNAAQWMAMDEFMKVLMRDNFWNDQADVDETHLHGGAVATKQ